MANFMTCLINRTGTHLRVSMKLRLERKILFLKQKKIHTANLMCTVPVFYITIQTLTENILVNSSKYLFYALNQTNIYCPAQLKSCLIFKNAKNDKLGSLSLAASSFLC